MKRRSVLIIMGGLSVLLVAGILRLVTGHRPPATQRTAVKSTYYCPMHPSYTSDRPGDCPICSMKLVKREPADRPTGRPANVRDICYLHNCPKLHEGQPCPMTVVAKPGERVTCPICGTHIAEASAPPQRRILYWTDPMIPGYKSDRAGTSPMGMELVPVYEEDATSRPIRSDEVMPPGYAPVLLTPQKQQLIGVKTAPAQKRPLTKTIRTVGVIAHDPELYQAQQEFIQAYHSWQAAAQTGSAPDVIEQNRTLVESSRFRLRHLGLSEELINEISAWKQPDHRLLLGGAGQYWVYASIYEYELLLAHPGQAVTVEVGALPGRAFAGTVKAIDPMLDPATRTARARVIVEDPDGLLKPSMYVNASIAVELGEVLAVPAEAIFNTGEKQIVFVDQGQGLFEPRDVVVGVRADAYQEITRGLNQGEVVVTSGNFLIDSESRLKAALEGMTPPPGSSPEASRRLDDVGGLSDRETGGGVTPSAGSAHSTSLSAESQAELKDSGQAGGERQHGGR